MRARLNQPRPGPTEDSQLVPRFHGFPQLRPHRPEMGVNREDIQAAPIVFHNHLLAVVGNFLVVIHPHQIEMLHLDAGSGSAKHPCRHMALPTAAGCPVELRHCFVCWHQHQRGAEQYVPRLVEQRLHDHTQREHHPRLVQPVSDKRVLEQLF